MHFWDGTVKNKGLTVCDNDVELEKVGDPALYMKDDERTRLSRIRWDLSKFLPREGILN